MRRLALALLLTAAACEDTSYKDIGGDINVLTQRTDALVPQAIRRLAKWKRRAIPQIEIALHTAPPAGKVNLLHALDAIGDPESAAILRHFAVYDPDPEVRAACDELLEKWSHASGPLGAAASAARVAVEVRRQQGEAPVVLGSPTK